MTGNEISSLSPTNFSAYPNLQLETLVLNVMTIIMERILSAVITEYCAHMWHGLVSWCLSLSDNSNNNKITIHFNFNSRFFSRSVTNEYITIDGRVLIMVGGWMGVYPTIGVVCEDKK